MSSVNPVYAVGPTGPALPGNLLILLGVVVLFMLPFNIMGNMIGGTTGTLEGTGENIMSVVCFIWLLLDIVIVIPLAAMWMLIRWSHRRRNRRALERLQRARAKPH